MERKSVNLLFFTTINNRCYSVSGFFYAREITNIKNEFKESMFGRTKNIST